MGASIWMVYTQALKTLGRQVLIYHLALTVFRFMSETEATCPDLVKKTVVICLELLHDLLNFTGALSPGKSQTVDCCLFLRHTGS